jgi:signal transduction histidine kinase
MLMLDGLLARTPFTEFALHIATTGELLLMSLGLGDRIRVLTAEKADEKRRADLKEARAAQLSTLVHVLCHDLVNPLTVMLGVAKLNLMKATMMPETPTDTKDWERVERACNNQTAIVNSVREMEAIIYGKRELPLTPLRLVEVYDNILFTFRARLEEKELELVTNFGQGGPMAGERVLVDPASFTHTVFSNLVSNAIKFSHPRGRIELLADGGGSQVRIVVRDYGIGMPESLKADIFEMTKKTTRAGTKGEKGTGFGMPLVKAYVERYGGRVTVESQPEGRPGQGTKFELLLQRAL